MLKKWLFPAFANKKCPDKLRINKQYWESNKVFIPCKDSYLGESDVVLQNT